MPIQSEQKKIISKRVSYLNNYFKNLLCKEKELMQLLGDKFIHVRLFSYAVPIENYYSSYTCRTHSDI